MRSRLIGAGAALVGLGLLLVVPLPAYVLRPGPVFPLADAVQLTPAEGAAGEGAEVSGEYLFTTILLEDATVADALLAAVRPDEQVVSRRGVLGGVEEAAFVAEQEALFAQAEDRAVAVGLRAVGSDLDPVAVEVRAEGVGGPSAGLLIALVVADLADPADVAGGRRIAGTGAITEDGAVEPVGSVADKVHAAESAGADLFLAPAEQLDAARAAARAVEVVGVSSVAEAVRTLLDR